MTDLAGTTWWLVGASEGLGRALAADLDKLGAHLILSARSADRLTELAETLTHARVVPMDVTDKSSVAKAAADAGQIDGFIYLAAVYDPVTAQNWDAAKVEAMCEVNFLGAVRCLGHVVPQFTKAGRGRIALIGSLAAYRGLPGAIGYGAGKAGLMHLAETLRADLWHTDITVQVMNPGYIETRLTDKNSFKMPFLMTPEAAAEHVTRALQTTRFKTDFPWLFSLVFRLGRLLPQGLYQRLYAPRKD